MGNARFAFIGLSPQPGSLNPRHQPSSLVSCWAEADWVISWPVSCDTSCSVTPCKAAVYAQFPGTDKHGAVMHGTI